MGREAMCKHTYYEAELDVFFRRNINKALGTRSKREMTSDWGNSGMVSWRRVSWAWKDG